MYQACKEGKTVVANGSNAFAELLCSFTLEKSGVGAKLGVAKKEKLQRPSDVDI